MPMSSTTTSPSANRFASAPPAFRKSKFSMASAKATRWSSPAPKPSIVPNASPSATDEDPMLKMSHLSKVYRTEVVETYALREFSINVRQGEFVAVTGPSGSGKTTFLTIAGLLEEFTGGDYELDGV